MNQLARLILAINCTWCKNRPLPAVPSSPLQFITPKAPASEGRMRLPQAPKPRAQGQAALLPLGVRACPDSLLEPTGHWPEHPAPCPQLLGEAPRQGLATRTGPGLLLRRPSQGGNRVSPGARGMWLLAKRRRWPPGTPAQALGKGRGGLLGFRLLATEERFRIKWPPLLGAPIWKCLSGWHLPWVQEEAGLGRGARARVHPLRGGAARQLLGAGSGTGLLQTRPGPHGPVGPCDLLSQVSCLLP